MSHRLSLSRLLPCLWWARSDVVCPDDPPGEKARIGTCVHGLCEERAGGRALNRADFTPQQLAEALSIMSGPLGGWVDAWLASPGEHYIEQRLRYDAEDDRVFETPRRGEADYSRPGPMQATGELDFVTVLDDAIEAIDLKTGRKENSLESQLRAYAVLAQRRWQRPIVRSAFLYARKTKVEVTPWITLDADQLDAEAGTIRRALRTLPTTERVRGDHCYRCPMGPRRGAGRSSPCPSWQSEYVPPDAPTEVYDDNSRLAF